MAILLCVAVALYCLMVVPLTRPEPTLEQSIADLASDDFQLLRASQKRISSAGRKALPLLFQILRSSTNSTQISLSCTLVGDIDPEAYRSLLKDSGVSAKLPAMLKYPNLKAVKKLAKDQQAELFALFPEAFASEAKEEKAVESRDIFFRSLDSEYKVQIKGELQPAIDRAFDEFETGRAQELAYLFGRPCGVFIRGTNGLGWKEIWLYATRNPNNRKYRTVELPELRKAAAVFDQLSHGNTQRLTVDEWKLVFGTNVVAPTPGK